MTPAHGSGTIVITEPRYRRELFSTTIGGWYWFGLILLRPAMGDLQGKHPPVLAVAVDVVIFSVLLWTLYRPWRMGIRIGDRGVTIRNYLRTRRVRWPEISALTDGTIDGSRWVLNVALRDGRHVTSTATGALRGSPRVLTAVRQAAARNGMPTTLSGIPPERPTAWVDAATEARRQRMRFVLFTAVTVISAAGTGLLIGWGSAHGNSYSPACLAGVVALIGLIRAAAAVAHMRKRQEAPPDDRYGEGSWFAVPLPRGAGFAPGVIARTEPRRDGIMLCYFFAPDGTSEPSLGQLLELRPARAVLIQKLDKLGKDWPRLGRAPEWDRSAWPLPAFCESTMKKRQTFKLMYDDDLGFVGEEISSHVELEGLPGNAILRAPAAPTAIARQLGPSSPLTIS